MEDNISSSSSIDKLSFPSILIFQLPPLVSNYFLLILKSSRTCVLLLPIPFTSVICSSMASWRRQFLLRIWPIQLAFLLRILFRSFLFSPIHSWKSSNKSIKWGNNILDAVRKDSFADVYMLGPDSISDQKILCSKFLQFLLRSKIGETCRPISYGYHIFIIVFYPSSDGNGPWK